MSVPNLIAALALSLIFSPCLASEAGGETEIPRYFYTGTLDGRYPIQMELDQSNGATPWQGRYFYASPKSLGERIQLNGRVDDQGQFQFSEFVEKGEEKTITGNFSGTFSPDRQAMRGHWHSADGKRNMPFELRLVARYRQRNAARDIRAEKTDDLPCPCPDPVKDEKDHCICRATASRIYPVLLGAESNALRGALEKQGLLDLTLGGDEGDQGESETDLTLAFHSDSLISLEINSYSYAWGAAHGMPGIAGLNLAGSPETGMRELKLKDLITTDKQCLGRINAAIMESLRKQEVPAMTEPQEWSIDLTRLYSRSFLVHPGALTFIFNPYEVGPYAIGIIKAAVPLHVYAECIPAKSPLAGFKPAD